MRGFGWEGTLWCWAVSGEAYWLWAGSLYWIVHCIYPANRQIDMGYKFAESYKMRKHSLSHNIWLPKHPWYSGLMTDYSQNSGYRYSTSLGTGMQKKKRFTAEEEHYSTSCTRSPSPPSYHQLFFPPQATVSLAIGSLSSTVLKSSSEYNRNHEVIEKGMNFNALLTLDSHIPHAVVVTASLLPWLQASPTQLHCQYLVSFMD